MSTTESTIPNLETPPVKIILTGLFLFQINPQANNRCEVGILKCLKHDLVFDIQKVSFDPKTGNVKSAERIEHSLDLKQDIAVQSVARSAGGMQKYGRVKIPDRLAPPQDRKDYGWIIDLVHDEFKGKRLKRRPQGTKLSPQILIDAGTIFTHGLSTEVFQVESHKDSSHARPYGPVAFEVGIAIDCQQLNLSNFSNGNTTNELKLSLDPGVRYFITIDNTCPPSKSNGAHSDIVFYYKAVTQMDNSDETFDLRRIVDDNAGGFGQDAHEEFCLGGTIGDGLG